MFYLANHYRTISLLMMSNLEHVYLFLIFQVLVITSASLWFSRLLDKPSAIIVLLLLENTMTWRSRNEGRLKFQWSNMHLSTLEGYFINLYLSCDFMDLRFAKIFVVLFSYAGPGNSRIRAIVVSYFTQGLHQFFRVPGLKKLLEEENRIKKHQLVKVFLSFLVELFYHSKTEDFDPYKNHIDKLEKELRFLLTVVGDESFIMLHEEAFQNLMAEFEEVANEAGSFIHSLLFPNNDRMPGKLDASLAVVLNHISLLKLNIMRFLNLLPCTSKPAYTTPETSLADSLILNSVIHDLEDLIFREGDPIADVKDQIKILRQGLIVLQSFIKGARSSEIGNMGHQTEYQIISFLSGDAPLWYIANRLAYIIRKIELIAAELREITNKHEIRDVEAAKHFNTPENIEIDDVIVCFKDRETKVLDYLIGRGKSLQVISMSGMPGIGKTTLAKRLFDHPSISTWFEKQSWCVASQKYERQKILAEVLAQINGEFDKDKTSKMDSESLVVRIHKTLYGRRYLIVIDDVWDDLVGCFPDDGNGSRILFTTRNKNVGPTNCDDYAVPSLSNEECWELLQKKVFGNNTCPPQLIGTGKGIAAKCWGLPLAVVVIAGILSSTDKKKNLWEEVGRNLASSVFNGGDNSSVMQILELSYKHLPQRLKPCFLYFRAFTQLKNVPVKKLMMLWISEGFVHKEQGKSAEDVSQQYLTELIDKSLVMVSKRRSDGGVKTCTLHDLLRELCFKICEYENFIKIEEKSMYSVYENGILHLVDPSFRDVTCSRSYCMQVRSLHGTLTQSPFYPGMMRLLRVLDLRCLFSHLTGVEYLVNLRYLVIYDLPAASIGSLGNLEYLRVLTEKTIRLPPAISRMIKLRHLNALFAVYCDSFQINNIESLSCIVIESVKDEEMLKYSPNLGKLKCVYQRGRLSSNFDLSFFSCLHSLKVVLCGSGMTEITFPRNVTKLSLYGSLSLPWEKMAIIGRLEKLEVLKLGLIPLEEGERWDARDGEIKWYTRDGEFQKLRFLKLDRLVSLTQWNVESSGHLPVLQRLVLCHCENLEEIPSEIGEIATLQLIEVKGRCAESLVESAKVIQQQQLEMENEELKVIINTH